MNAKNDTKVNEIVTSATVLFDERVQFEQAIIAQTNKGLYEILAKVYALYVQAINDGCLDESVTEIKDVLAERGVKTQKNTKSTAVFVRYVFNSDRKRTYTYSKTLEAALKADVVPGEFSEFLTDNKGIEETKKTKGLSEKQQQKRDDFENAKSVIAERLETMKPMHVLELNGASVDLSDDVDYAFVIARKNAAGDLELLQAIPTSTAVMQKTAINSLAKQLVESNSNADANGLQEEASKEIKVTFDKDEIDNVSISTSVFDNAVKSTIAAQQ